MLDQLLLLAPEYIFFFFFYRLHFHVGSFDSTWFLSLSLSLSLSFFLLRFCGLFEPIDLINRRLITCRQFPSFSLYSFSLVPHLFALCLHPLRASIFIWFDSIWWFCLVFLVPSSKRQKRANIKARKIERQSSVHWNAQLCDYWMAFENESWIMNQSNHLDDCSRSIAGASVGSGRILPSPPFLVLSVSLLCYFVIPIRFCFALFVCLCLFFLFVCWLQLWFRNVDAEPLVRSSWLLAPEQWTGELVPSAFTGGATRGRNAPRDATDLLNHSVWFPTWLCGVLSCNYKTNLTAGDWLPPAESMTIDRNW